MYFNDPIYLYPMPIIDAMTWRPVAYTACVPIILYKKDKKIVKTRRGKEALRHSSTFAGRAREGGKHLPRTLSYKTPSREWDP